ncbi:MAG TPA: hypothetical protein DD490_23225 [Acidobacteria bacterium]|nr:hypothetical protein [Acidobacteriota bacterium]
MAEQIETRFGIKPQLLKGSGGVFEVTVGGELIFSKKQTGRFPNPGEVEAVLEAKVAAV